MRIYIRTQKALKDHGPCESGCNQHILPGQRYALVYEFNQVTRQPGRSWKRHESCIPLLVESRERDAVQKGSRNR